MAEDLLEQLLDKIKKVPCYGLQLDESSDIGSRAQLLVYIRIPDIDSYSIVDEYLCCLDLGVWQTPYGLHMSFRDLPFAENQQCKNKLLSL